MYQNLSIIHYPVLQSSAEKRFLKYFIQRQNEENIRIYNYLKKQQSLKRAEFNNAHDLFMQKIQPLQNELTILQLKHNKPESNNNNMDSKEIDSPSETILIDMKIMLRNISNALHNRGNFYNPQLFDAAMSAFKNNNAALLFDLWNSVANRSEQKREDIVTAEDENEKYAQSLRLYNHINIAINCIKKQIEDSENNELLQEYKMGTENFIKYIEKKAERIRTQIEKIKAAGEGEDNV